VPLEESPDLVGRPKRVKRRTRNGAGQRLDRAGPVVPVPFDGGEEDLGLAPTRPVAHDADPVPVADHLRLGRAAVEPRPGIDRFLHRRQGAAVAPGKRGRSAVVEDQRVGRAGQIVNRQGPRQAGDVDEALRRDRRNRRDPVGKMGAESEGHPRAVGKARDIDAARVDGQRPLQRAQQRLEEMDIVDAGHRQAGPLIAPDIGIEQKAALEVRPHRQSLRKNGKEIFRVGFLRPAVSLGRLLRPSSRAMEKKDDGQRLSRLESAWRNEHEATVTVVDPDGDNVASRGEKLGQVGHGGRGFQGQRDPHRPLKQGGKQEKRGQKKKEAAHRNPQTFQDRRTLRHGRFFRSGRRLKNEPDQHRQKDQRDERLEPPVGEDCARREWRRRPGRAPQIRGPRREAGFRLAARKAGPGWRRRGRAGHRSRFRCAD
jgi:hypothetical protein